MGKPIILDGCDCVGKSTVAEELARITGYKIVKGSSFEISKLGQAGMFEHMMSLLDARDIIIDRFYMSNYVYGWLFNYPTMTHGQFTELAEKTRKTAFPVYLFANYSTIIKRLEQRGDDMIIADDIGNIQDWYEKALFSPYGYKTALHINTTYATKPNLIAATIAEIVALQETSMLIGD